MKMGFRIYFLRAFFARIFYFENYVLVLYNVQWVYENLYLRFGFLNFTLPKNYFFRFEISVRCSKKHDRQIIT